MFFGQSNKTSKFTKVFKTSILTVALTASLTACTPRIASHGNYPRPEQLEVLIPGEANKQVFLEVLGPPTTVGTFDSEVWFYMAQQFERFAFFEADLIEMNVIAFRFNNSGILEDYKTYDLANLRNISIDDSVTPTAGHEIGVLQQLFGNFGRLN